MADLYNEFPSWGETGAYPADGFFYEGGDQVNEKHMDALWNGVKKHIDNLNQGIRDRVRLLHGDVVLDQGLVASKGTNTREVDVSASNDGAFVDGQFTGSTSATTLTLSSNGTSSTRTDSIWVDTAGTVGVTEGTTSVANDRLKVAEVDVASDDTISAVRNYARDHAHHAASEQQPNGAEPGDIWTDLGSNRTKVRQGGAYQTVITEQDDVTISGGDGLKGGNTTDLVGGGTLSLDIEPADFAGHGLEDDGADNLRLDAAAIGTGINGGDGTNLSLDESVIKDGGVKEIDAAEFAGGDGTSGEVLKTDGSNAFWGTVPQPSASEGGTTLVSTVGDFNWVDSADIDMNVTDDGDSTVTIKSSLNDTYYYTASDASSFSTSGRISTSIANDGNWHTIWDPSGTVDLVIGEVREASSIDVRAVFGDGTKLTYNLTTGENNQGTMDATFPPLKSVDRVEVVNYDDSTDYVRAHFVYK